MRLSFVRLLVQGMGAASVFGIDHNYMLWSVRVTNLSEN